MLVDGKQYAQHTDGNSTHGGQAISTRAWFTVNGKGIVCVGDPVSCGSNHAIGTALAEASANKASTASAVAALVPDSVLDELNKAAQ